MANAPLISVVMGVYNEADTLPRTLNSVLCQKEVNLEFIVVNDGSIDHSIEILGAYAAKDNRLKIIDQSNQGLTQSLIKGCEAAQGRFIARQDAGDVSMPGRLKIQLDTLLKHPEVVLVSGGTRYIGPEGEYLFEVQKSSKEADAALRSADVSTLRGPSHHGCTMFRRSDYIRSGGYRSQFKVAQDLDLWTRLIELGKHEVVQDVLYQASLLPGAISSTRRKQQVKNTEVIAECMALRLEGRDESEVLSRLALNQNIPRAISQKWNEANFYYFVGACLVAKDPSRSAHYFECALRKNVLHIKALLRLVQAKLNTQ